MAHSVFGYETRKMSSEEHLTPKMYTLTPAMKNPFRTDANKRTYEINQGYVPRYPQHHAMYMLQKELFLRMLQT